MMMMVVVVLVEAMVVILGPVLGEVQSREGGGGGCEALFLC